MDEIAIVRAELVRQRDEARKTIQRGVLLIGLIPIVIGLALALALVTGVTGGVLALLGAATYTIVGGVGGVAMIAGGAVESRRLSRQLYKYDHVRLLPEARVVVRGN